MTGKHEANSRNPVADDGGARNKRRISWGAIGALAAVASAVVAAIALIDEKDPQERVHVRVSTQPLVQDIWIVPRRARKLSPPAAGQCQASALQRRAEWFAGHGGALAGSQIISVEVVNDSDRTMTVAGLRLKHFRVLPPIRGVGHHLCPQPGGGPFDEQYTRIDFDRKPRAFRYFDRNFKRVRAVSFAPAPHEPLRFWIEAHAEKRRYEWTAVLDYSLDGQKHEVLISDGGKPFEITGCSITPRPRACPPAQ